MEWLNPMNRQQRRAATKKLQRSPSELDRVEHQAQIALQALQKINGLENTVGMLDKLHNDVQEAARSLQSLASNMAYLDAELGQQRRLNESLLEHLLRPSEQSLSKLQEIEKNSRPEQPDEEP